MATAAETPSKRNPLLRYWPLVAVLAIQALIIAVAPSTAPGAGSQLSSVGPQMGGNGGYAGPSASGSSAGTSSSSASASTPGATASGAGGGGAATASAAGGGGSSSAFVAGDTSHCADGREFSTTIVWYAPPCTAGTIGAADPANGSATYQGVTGNQITVVDYVTDYGPEVNAILAGRR